MTLLRSKPTNAELEILRVLWARGPSTVRDVARAMGREDAYTTVLKLLQNRRAPTSTRRHGASSRPSGCSSPT
jgi:BlaI family penicillinase repressor